MRQNYIIREMKIVITHEPSERIKYTDQHLKRIKELSSDLEVSLIDDTKVAIELLLPETDVLICSTPENIDLSIARNLKWVQITSAGANKMAEKLKGTDILLTNASGVHPIPISEHIFTFLLMFARGIDKAHRAQVQDRQWKRNLSPQELYGKTLGIVGYGRIGKETARLGKAFGMKVIALSHHETPADEHIDEFYPQEKIDDLLNVSDFVVNCLPLTIETEHFFNHEKFICMKSTAYFINIGRGKTVAEKDLITALSDGTIAGAGLDVFEEEPLQSNSELWRLENVIITPHIAGWTPEYTNRVVDIFIENLKAFIDNKPMPTLVDKTTGY